MSKLEHMLHYRVRPPPPLTPLFKGGIDLTKNPKKEKMEKLLKGTGNPMKGGIL